MRLIAGLALRPRSPVATFSEMFYADAALEPGARLPLEAEHEERGIYVVDGSVEIAGDRFEAGAAPGVPPGRPDHAHRARRRRA